MENLEQFKSFVRKIPSVREDVLGGKYTWQQVYEMYVLYGEDHDIWSDYRNKDTKSSSSIAGLDLNTMLALMKNVDLNALSSSLDGLQKILGLVSTLVVKDETQNLPNDTASFRRYDD